MCSGEDQQARKLRGGYYTPHPVARFLTSWAIRSCNDSVLEPSCGDGAFVEIASRLLDGGSGTVTAIEIIEAEADKAQKRGGAKANVVAGDAFGWWSAERGKIGQFDAVIGNPPFLAYHYFPSRTREHAFAMMRQEGLNPTKLTNAWSPFVVLSTRALRQGGRLALVLPAELMQVNYAADLRRFLAQRFGVLHMILFRNLVFESVQQEVVLLLGERDDTKPATLWVDEVATAEDLQHLNIDYPPESLPRTTMEPVRDKWTQYLLDRRTSGFLREMQRSVAIPRLGNHGIVGVGVLTGNNDFFAVTKEQAYRAGIDGWCVPLISGARHVPYLVLSEADWRRLYRQNEHVLLLVAEHGSRSALPDPVRRYIADGERAGAHTGYKCQARLPAWWRVPDPWVPDLFMLRHIHDAPRVIVNGAGVTCTVTLLRFRANPGVDALSVAGMAMNSMTFAFAEVMGRSYGGGVLDLPPGEASALPFPVMNGIFPTEEMDSILRSGGGVEDVADVVDRLTLRPMGITQDEIGLLRSAWRVLSSRRKRRSGAIPRNQRPTP